jgi:outer membrane lipoprotein-sorting protein
MNNRKTEQLKGIAEQAVPEGIDLWPGIRSQVKGVTAHTAQDGARNSRPNARQRVVIGVSAVAMTALIISATSPLWNVTQPVNAEAILDQAQSAADGVPGVNAYHLIMTRQIPSKGNIIVTTETWYGGADRQRSATQAQDASGAIAFIYEEVYSGTQAWIATTDDRGQTHVEHATGIDLMKPGDLIPGGNTLADVLAQYSNTKSCNNAVSQGESTFAGRAVYVISVTPKPEGCATQVTGMIDQKTGKPADGKQGTVKAYGVQMRIQVDKVSFLPLMTELLDETGAVMELAQVTELQYNIAIPDSTFTYTPPAGAVVTDINGPTAGDVKGALRDDSTQNRQPVKSP